MNPELVAKVKTLLEKINPDSLRQKVRELEAESEKNDFWTDHLLAAKKMQTLTLLQSELVKLNKLEDWLLEIEMGEIKTDEAGGKNLEIEKLVKEMETQLYLSGPYDSNGAILSVHSGQGGVEAMDWASMVSRMYQRFAEIKGWSIEEVNFEPGEEAGIKEVVFEISGPNAYGMLKNESGVHRLVRQSPFNADHLRQTSFALVEVVPMVDDAENLSIREEDLEWDFFRSGGKGGQNVNKVSSAVRLKHIPSGIIVSSQKERSQEQNRKIALQILQGKLLQREEDQRREEEMRLRGKHVTPGWGNQIRSYVLHPYHMVKDLRTEYEESDTDSVLDGKIEKFIESELSYFAQYDKV